MSAMEEWQRRQRAEKEAARKKKTESAELLRGYRGGVNDEELKLRTLREEERRKTIDAQQNLHNYKGVGGVNEEDLKLRMLREEERRKTMEAEQNLHNYKGAAGENEEELKLRTMKKEERRKTMDAQHNLHQYNGTAAVEQQLLQQPQKNPKKQTEDANLPVPVNAGSASNKDHLAGVDFGSVSVRAAALAAAAEAAGEIPSPTASCQGGKSKPTVDANPKTVDDQTSEAMIPSVPAIHEHITPAEEDCLVVEDKEAKASPTEIGSAELEGGPVSATANAMMHDEKKESFPSEESLETEENPEKGPELTDETPNTVTPLVTEKDEPPSTEPSSSLALDTKEEETQPPTEPDKPSTPQAPVDTSESSAKEKEASSGAGSDLASKCTTEQPTPAPSTAPTTTKESDSSLSQPVATEPAVMESPPVSTSPPIIASPAIATSDNPQSPAVTRKKRVNVLFSFGVVSTQDTPDLFGYMAAVEKVVQARLEKSNCDGITFDPKMRPFVKKTNNDPSFSPDEKGRSDIKRMLVTAAVPMFFTAPATKQTTKKLIVDALQKCIQSGQFLKMALEMQVSP